MSVYRGLNGSVGAPTWLDEVASVEQNVSSQHIWPIFHAHCQTALTPMDEFQVALGTILLVLSSLSIIPSLTKPHRRRSTDGVSAATLILTNAQQTTQVANIWILKSEQVPFCFQDFWGCQSSMIALYSATIAWFLLFFQYQCKVWYPGSEENKKTNRKLWFLQIIFAASLLFWSFLWSCMAKCSESIPLQFFGVANGVLSSMLMMVRFAPQLIQTCRHRSAGSISYITYGVIGVGGFLQTYFQIAGSKETWSTWMPVFVGNCFQTVILILCVYFDCVKPRELQADGDAGSAGARQERNTGTELSAETLQNTGSGHFTTRPSNPHLKLIEVVDEDSGT